MGGPPPSYPYGHPSRMMEEKTILRKKFSWKHYPELERFLIANRDEYLKHSNMNYTAEQKQYNNWLTERLLEMAGKRGFLQKKGAKSKKIAHVSTTTTTTTAGQKKKNKVNIRDSIEGREKSAGIRLYFYLL